MNVIGIVTARGGSKGVPRKNLQRLSGKTLLNHTADCALAATRLARVIVTTDDEEIAAEARRCGLETPFLRPASLAEDNTPTLPVLQHAVEWLEESGEQVDAICLLQPTHPFRRAEDIDRCIELLESSGADSAVTIAQIPDEHNPHWAFFRDAEGSLTLSTGEATIIPRRQELPPAFYREGSVYVIRRDVLMKQNSLYGSNLKGLLVDMESRVNIDTPADLEHARSVVGDGAVNQEGSLS